MTRQLRKQPLRPRGVQQQPVDEKPKRRRKSSSKSKSSDKPKEGDQ
jgi:hypothetical protein